MKYLISYDLNSPGQDYTTLTETLEKWGAKKVLYSQWVVRQANTGPKAIFEALWKLMDPNDYLLVVQMDGTAWWGRTMNKIKEI